MRYLSVINQATGKRCQHSSVHTGCHEVARALVHQRVQVRHRVRPQLGLHRPSTCSSESRRSKRFLFERGVRSALEPARPVPSSGATSISWAGGGHFTHWRRARFAAGVFGGGGASWASAYSPLQRQSSSPPRGAAVASRLRAKTDRACIFVGEMVACVFPPHPDVALFPPRFGSRPNSPLPPSSDPSVGGN